jgi:hypothetical protein
MWQAIMSRRREGGGQHVTSGSFVFASCGTVSSAIIAVFLATSEN